MATLLDALRTELVTAGVGRMPRVDNQDLPPIWVAKSPLDGPGDAVNPVERGRDAVIGLYLAGGIPTEPMNQNRRQDRVDVWLRVLPNQAGTAYRLGAAIRAAVLTQEFNWKMGGATGIRVIQSREWGALQPVETGTPGASDTWIYQLLFETYAGPDGWLAEPA